MFVYNFTMSNLVSVFPHALRHRIREKGIVTTRKELGKLIQKGLDGTFLHTAKIKSKSKIQPIDSLCNTVVIKEGKYINLKPTSLFTRLTALAKREDHVKKLFKYEITAVPMSLFKHGMMCKPDKVATIL